MIVVDDEDAEAPRPADCIAAVAALTSAIVVVGKHLRLQSR